MTVSIPPAQRLESLLELGVRAEGRVVVELDVRDDSDRRRQREDAAVRLVALDDEPAAPGPRVAAELGNLAADEERRVAAEPVEHEGDHRRGRRLAVCAGDDDRVREADELGKELRRGLAPSTRPANAVETKASASAGGSGGPSEISTGIPAARTPSRYGVSRRSQPLTSAPHALARIP